jgi:hypothetical protein
MKIFSRRDTIEDLRSKLRRIFNPYRNKTSIFTHLPRGKPRGMRSQRIQED